MSIIFLLLITGILLLNRSRFHKLYVIIPSCLRFEKYLNSSRKKAAI